MLGTRLIPLIPGILVVASLLPSAAGAQERNLTLLAAVDRALETHPSLAAASAGLDAAVGRADGARAERFPSIAASASSTRYQEPMIVTPIHGLIQGETPPFDETLFQGAIQLNYTLFDGGVRGAQARSGEVGVRVAESHISRAYQGLVLATGAAFLDLVGAREVMTAHELRLQALRAELERVRLMEDVGKAAEVDRLRVEAAVASAEAESVSLLTAAERGEGRLARLMGEPVEVVRNATLSPVPPLAHPLPASEALLNEATANNPELQVARQEAAAASLQVQVARGTRWPKLDLAAAYVQRGAESVDFQGEWSVGIQLSVPLFTGGAISSRIRGTKAQARSAGAQVRIRELEVEGEVEEALTAVREALARAASLEAVVERAREVARVEQLRVQTGIGAETDYLNAEASLMEAQSTLIRARQNGLVAALRLRWVVGGLTPEWLQEMLGT